MNIKKTLLKLFTKSFSVRDASSFDRAFADWKLQVSGEDLVGWIAACTNVWGTYFTKANFRIYEETNKGMVELPDHPFRQMMKKPNDYQVWWEIQYQLALWWVLYGKAFWLKLRNLKGDTVQLVQLKPWLVEVVSDNESYIAGFDYKTTTDVIHYKPSDIIYLKIPATSGFTEGRSIISGFLDQQEVDQFQTSYQKKFYKEGGFAGRTFVAKQELGRVNFDRILESLTNQYGGEENAFKVALLEMIEPVKAAYSIKDMDIANQRILTRDEILGGMQVPKIMLGIGESVNRATAETAVWQFASGIVDPQMSYVDQVLSAHLRNDYKNNNLIVVHDIIAPKDASQAVLIQKDKFNMGALTLNEVRKLDGRTLYSFPLADKPLIYLGGNMINLEDEVIIGVQADQPDDSPDSNPGDVDANDDKKSIKEVERTWKQFARRHEVLSNKAKVEWKQFFNEQRERLEQALQVKDMEHDLDTFYLSDLELVLLNDIVSKQFHRNSLGGFDLGNNILNGNGIYNPQNQFLSNTLNGLSRQSIDIQKATLNNIRRFIGENMNNLSNAEMSRVIKQQYGDIESNRIPKIVNTTVTAGLNSGLLHSFQEAGMTKKRWLTEGDSRVRNRPEVSHVEANGQEVALTSPFIVSGEELMFPGDPSASAKNVINCRCTIIGIK